ncbi:MAG: helix-turn-helix domain-containing protein, partial [Planctomycetota bacterium]|nr:helix-turn-helix domain-containing protein [Planctomycetota bacterium]
MPPKKCRKTKSIVQSLDRAIDIIEALGNSRGGLSIATLCSITGLHKSTVHRLLAALKERGYVVQNDGGAYRLTFRICLLSRQLIDGVNLVGVAKPCLKKLCDISQETVHLVLREG